MVPVQGLLIQNTQKWVETSRSEFTTPTQPPPPWTLENVTLKPFHRRTKRTDGAVGLEGCIKTVIIHSVL